MKSPKVTYMVDRDEVEVNDPLHAPVGPQTSQELGRRYTRQSTKARQHWKTVKKHVEQKSDKRESVRDKWVNLTRSLSHEMGDFFVSTDLNITKEVKDDWQSRSRRLHQRSILIGNKKTTPTESITIPPLLSGGGDDDDEADIDLSGWLCKTPEGRVSIHSRQQSRISSGSCKRMTRTRPSLKLEKDSVLKMAVNGFKNWSKVSGYVGSAPQRERSSVVRSRSITPATVHATVSRTYSQADEYVDEQFFNVACPTSPVPAADRDPQDLTDYASFESFDTVDGERNRFQARVEPQGGDDDDILRPRPRQQRQQQTNESFKKRLPNEYVKAVPPNTDRRQYGIGMVGNLLGTDYRESRLDSKIYEEMSQLHDYRPFFTYWVTFVQIVIYIFTIVVYDVAPVAETDRKAEVRMINLGKGIAHYKEQGNMWFGPGQADLIHLGAKYSPCMRLDKNVVDNLEIDRTKERGSGCCIYNDGSGCAQMVESKCSKTFASWKNMTVCGQDPYYCRNSTLHHLQWSKDDITQWPICLNKTVPPTDEPKHMTCEVIARPCCTGIHGQCIITTNEDCEFRKGYFHPEANLCSQVKTCLSELCGMLPFYDPGYPNQFYRLWTSLLLHAGLVQLLITVVLQFLVLRDLEKLLGWFRIGFIYIFSGIAGSLASAIFLPYHAEAGPSGSQFSVIACLFVEVIHSWNLIDRPFLAVGKLALILVFLFIAGLLPWVDNYAHLFGFIFGFLLSFALMPYVNFGTLSKKGRMISVAVCLLLVIGIFSLLIVLFYISPIYSCPYCHYFNCIPFTRSFCKSTEVNIENNES